MRLKSRFLLLLILVAGIEAHPGAGLAYANEVRGYNSRLDELQAALLSVKLSSLDDDNERRRRIARAYLAGIRAPSVTLPQAIAEEGHVWHLFVIRHPCRDELQRRLTAAGVQTLIHYPVAPHLQPAYRDLELGSGSLPISESIHAEVLSLPISPVMTDRQVDRVIEVVVSAAEGGVVPCAPHRSARNRWAVTASDRRRERSRSSSLKRSVIREFFQGKRHPS